MELVHLSHRLYCCYHHRRPLLHHHPVAYLYIQYLHVSRIDDGWMM